MLLWGFTDNYNLRNLGIHLRPHQGIDIFLSVLICLLLLIIIRDSRVRWLIQGLLLILLASFISRELGFNFTYGVLEKIILGAVIVTSISFQTELRRFLEKLGRGELMSLFHVYHNPPSKTKTIVDPLVDAVKELSNNRTGALILLETETPIQSRLKAPGVTLNAEVSKELIQTIFQKQTLLHDGAIVIKNGLIASAGTILPLSERTAPSQYGTRHRAAMGITEQVEDALCIVVSEETGLISLAQAGTLNRFLTTIALKEQLEAKLMSEGTRDSRETWELGQKFSTLFKNWFNFTSSTSKDKK
jgi:uncharacterized protein (TIGR00159 family)